MHTPVPATRLLVVLAVMLCAACGPSAPRAPATETPVPTRPAPTPTPTVEYQLAAIQANSLPGELLVNQFRHELTKLSAACGQTEIALSDKTVVAHNLLFKEGVNVSYLDILRDMNTIVGDHAPTGCDELIATYVYLRSR